MQSSSSLQRHPVDLHSVAHLGRWKGLWRMMAGYRGAYLAAMVALALASLSKTATYLLLRYFADLVAGEETPILGHTLPQAFAWVAAGFVLLAFFQGGFSFLSGRLSAYTAEGIARRLRDYLFDHIQRLSVAYHSHASTGDLVERVTSDVDAVRRFFADQVVSAGRIVLMMGINFAAIYYLYPKLAWVSVIVLPFVLALSLWFFKRVSKTYERYQQQESRLITTLQENLSGVRVVKAFARQEYEKQKFERENWMKYRLGKTLTFLHGIFWPFTDILLGAQMLGGFVYAALLAIHGEITVGTYLAYVGLVGRLIMPIRGLGRMIVQASTGLVSYDRLAVILRETPEPLEDGDFIPDGPARGELVFEHVGFTYDDDTVPALEDITFRCEPGQAVALLGSTGSGKTTLVNLIPRFHEYTEGRILLDGVELKRYPRAWLRRQIGIVEQEPFLFSRSIRENIAYGAGREVSQEEIEAAARAAAIHDEIMAFPDGYDTVVGERGVMLSGGQKQRIAIARALLKDPRILILDDATSSVDAETEAAIHAALTRLMEGRTTFIIAHRIQSVMEADLILVMDKGRIVQRGTHEELLAQEGMYRQIYAIQTRIDEELQKELAAAEE
ncbi:MAG: ABC transporter ATP-binding protein [Chloroflexi bacterium]|nr:ABC transporter ATP-binding protein [Chloroflexota bacterium]